MEELQPQDQTAPPAESAAANETAATDESGPTATDGAGEEGAGTGSYKVHLDDFEGPLDLLLYLIQRDEIDIYDIPIAHITSQYLQYIELLDMFDLDNAGEFLVMASTLMRIKARLLLPVQRPGEEDEDEGDPRDELVRRLLEYKKYKEAAQELQQKEEERRNWHPRGTAYPFIDEAEEEPAELALSLFDLLRAVKNVLEGMRGESTHHVYTEVYTVEGQEELIRNRLNETGRLRFEELFSGMKVKMEVVVTFVALLDLLKNQRVRAHQASAYGEIWLEAREPDPGDEVDVEVEHGEPAEDGVADANDLEAEAKDGKDSEDAA